MSENDNNDSNADNKAAETTTKTSNVRRKASKLDNARIRQILQDEERLQQHLQPLFYAMLRGTPAQEQEQKQKQQEPPQQQPKQPTKPTKKQSKAHDVTAPPPVVPIDDYIPQTHEAIKQTTIFQMLYRQIQFQRDQYLVGTEYATWHDKERQKSDNVQVDPNDSLPHDVTALGHAQIARLAADFIPSATVVQATLPLVTPLATTTLYPLLRQATHDQVLAQQANLNAITKSALIDFLKNPQNRLAIKKSTYGFIETKYATEGE